MEIFFTEEALNDLDELRDFLIDAEVPQFKEIIDRLLIGIQKLGDHPSMGIVVGQAGDVVPVRDLFVDRYCVRYSLQQRTVVILRLWHQRENERNL
jgi:plasmid stabilization system protein ParE